MKLHKLTVINWQHSNKIKQIKFKKLTQITQNASKPIPDEHPDLYLDCSCVINELTQSNLKLSKMLVLILDYTKYIVN